MSEPKIGKLPELTSKEKIEAVAKECVTVQFDYVKGLTLHLDHFKLAEQLAKIITPSWSGDDDFVKLAKTLAPSLQQIQKAAAGDSE